MNCKFCGKEVDNVKLHVSQLHPAMEFYVTEEVDRKTCPECGADNMKNNQRCDNCLKPFSGEGHNDFECPDCGFKTADKAEYEDHKLSHGDEGYEAFKEWECQDCGEKIPKGQAGKHQEETGHHNISKSSEKEEKLSSVIDKLNKENEPEGGWKDEDYVGENWDFKSHNDKSQAFEGIGFSQGDALKLADISWYDLSTEVQHALEVEEEDKEEHRKSSTDIFNKGDQPETKIDNLDEIDYDIIINESQTSRTKYECERCDTGFRSNEALMTHFNDTHTKSNEFVLDVKNECPFCEEDIDPNTTMGEHLSYNHGINLPQGGSYAGGDTYMGEGNMEGARHQMHNDVKRLNNSEEPPKDGIAHQGYDWQEGEESVESDENINSCPNCGYILSGEVQCPSCGKDNEFSMANPEYEARVAKKKMKQDLDYGNGDIMDDDRTSEFQNGYENIGSCELSGGDWTLNDDESIATCVKCGKTFYDEGKAQDHEMAHAPLDSLFNISGMSGVSDGSCKSCGGQTDGDYTGHLRSTHGVDYIGESKKKSNEAHIIEATEIMGYEESGNPNHDDDTGRFTSGSGGGSSSDDGGSDDGGKHAGTSEKDLIKQIKGGSKDWHDWGRNENTEELYAEIEKRNKAIPKPTGGYPKIFRDDPDAVSKMEQKIAYVEKEQAYWKSIIKFPNRDYQNHSQLGDAKWYETSLISTKLREAKKKLEQIKGQGDLTRHTTYAGGRKSFYYKEEPKGEALSQQDRETLDSLKSGRIEGVHDPQREDRINDLESRESISNESARDILDDYIYDVMKNDNPQFYEWKLYASGRGLTDGEIKYEWDDWKTESETYESISNEYNDDDEAIGQEPFGTTRSIKKMEDDPEGHKKEWSDATEEVPLKNSIGVHPDRIGQLRNPDDSFATGDTYDDYLAVHGSNEVEINIDGVGEWFNNLSHDEQTNIIGFGHGRNYETLGSSDQSLVVVEYRNRGLSGESIAKEYMLEPSSTDSTQCVICGQSVDDHSNPSTYYRGMHGTAPPTDHYFLGGNVEYGLDKYGESISKEAEDDDKCIECGASGRALRDGRCAMCD